MVGLSIFGSIAGSGGFGIQPHSRTTWSDCENQRTMLEIPQFLPEAEEGTMRLPDWARHLLKLKEPDFFNPHPPTSWTEDFLRKMRYGPSEKQVLRLFYNE